MGSSAETASRLGKWLGSVRRWYRTPQPAIAPSRSIGLALGGGFARGIAHVGVLRVFEQYQIPIKYIAGVSAGSMVAAAYAYVNALNKLLVKRMKTAPEALTVAR